MLGRKIAVNWLRMACTVWKCLLGANLSVVRYLIGCRACILLAKGGLVKMLALYHMFLVKQVEVLDHYGKSARIQLVDGHLKAVCKVL